MYCLYYLESFMFVTATGSTHTVTITSTLTAQQMVKKNCMVKNLEGWTGDIGLHQLGLLRLWGRRWRWCTTWTTARWRSRLVRRCGMRREGWTS